VRDGVTYGTQTPRDSYSYVIAAPMFFEMLRYIRRLQQVSTIRFRGYWLAVSIGCSEAEVGNLSCRHICDTLRVSTQFISEYLESVRILVAISDDGDVLCRLLLGGQYRTPFSDGLTALGVVCARLNYRVVAHINIR